MNNEERLVELETRVAFQDDTIQTLSDMIAQQQFEMEAMQRQIRELSSQLKSNQSLMRDLQQEVPPPHY